MRAGCRRNFPSVVADALLQHSSRPGVEESYDKRATGQNKPAPFNRAPANRPRRRKERCISKDVPNDRYLTLLSTSLPCPADGFIRIQPLSFSMRMCPLHIYSEYNFGLGHKKKKKFRKKPDGIHKVGSFIGFAKYAGKFSDTAETPWALRGEGRKFAKKTMSHAQKDGRPSPLSM